MALTGVHVACVRAGAVGTQGLPSGLPVYTGAPVWSENVTSAGAGTKYVPDPTPSGISWVLVINAASAAYVAVGAVPGTPSATNGYYIPAGGKIDIAAPAGATWAWAAA